MRLTSQSAFMLSLQTHTEGRWLRLHTDFTMTTQRSRPVTVQAWVSYNLPRASSPSPPCSAVALARGGRS